MARLKEACSHCGQEASVAIGQAIATGDELVWSRSVKCEHCGSVKEFDDSGLGAGLSEQRRGTPNSRCLALLLEVGR
jgi:DNA-directed RNA polymerase subunit RPC12/RpoP